MGLFDKKRVEEPYVPLLFCEIKEASLPQFFPELLEPTNESNDEKLKRVLLERTKDSESRNRILAWKALRQLSVFPDESIKREVLGYVAEVGLEAGVDYLAVYSDNTARYYNFSGSAIIYEQANNEEVDNEIQKLLVLCKTTVEQLSTWNAKRRSPPQNTLVRLTFMTPEGLFFGEGPMSLLEQDVLAKDIIQQSVVVMKLLMELSLQKNT